MAGNLRWIVWVAAFLCACATEPASHQTTAQQAEQADAKEFRKHHPIDAKTVDSVLADYDRVQSALLMASRRGAKANVSVQGAAGQIHFGHDEFFSGETASTKEIRDNYIAIQVGTDLCIVNEGFNMNCKVAEPLHLGLPQVDRTHIAKVWTRDISCLDPVTACRFLKIQLSAAESDTNSNAGFSDDPDLVGHDYEVVFVVSTDLPVYLRQTDHYHVGVTATAFYGFDFNSLVDPIELPQGSSGSK